MSTTQSTPNKQQQSNSAQAVPQKTSALQRLTLGFEYDKTLQEIRRNVRARTL